MAIGRGGTGTLQSVRNLSLLMFADAMVLLVIGAISASIHGSVRDGVPVYYAGAFLAAPLVAAIAGVSFAIFMRVKTCSCKPEVTQKIGGLMKAYCVCLAMSWPGWFIAMMLTGITGICRNSGCSYNVHETSNFSLAIIIMVCVGLAFFANVLCTMFLYVYCSEMGLTIYGTRRIKVGDIQVQNGAKAGQSFTPVTATTECQTLPSLTATAQCQTQPAFSVHDSFQPFYDSHGKRMVNKNETTTPVWEIPPDELPSEQAIRDLVEKYHSRDKKKNKKKRHKENKYKRPEKTSELDSSLPPLDKSDIYSPSGVHIDSFGGMERVLSPSSPRRRLAFHRQSSGSPPSVHSPDYLHVQLPNAPLPSDQEKSLSYQVSYLPFQRNRQASPSIRIPTATPPPEFSPPVTPSFRTTAWQESPASSQSCSPVRCTTPQPGSSCSSDTPPSIMGDPFLPTLQSRYNPTPPPTILSPRGRGMLFTDADDDEDNSSFTP